jgi:AcrR family transcriptional regulator
MYASTETSADWTYAVDGGDVTQATRIKQPELRRRRTQAERRDESDRNLIAAAIEIIADEGVSAATFEAIGRRAGYSRGLAGQRFGSKQGLIEAVIAHLLARTEELFTIHRLDERPGLEALLAYLDIVYKAVALSKENQAYFRLLSAALADVSEQREVFAAAHQVTLGQLERLFARGQREGQIRRDLSPVVAGRMIGSIILGLSAQILAEPGTEIGPIREASLTALKLAFAPPDEGTSG